MTPQGPAAPAAPANGSPAVEEVPHAALLKLIDDTPADKRTSAQKQVARARTLERERADVMKRISANREYLRLMEENEELTDDEGDWLDDFYPQKEKGQSRSDDEIERTRKAKAAARS